MLIVVGGTRRKVGKTSVVCGIVSGLCEWRWTAVKVSAHSHEHSRPESTPDSGRYLDAGAVRSYWIRTPAGEIERTLPLLNGILSESENVIVESNSVVYLLKPDFSVMVIDDYAGELKPSSRRFLERADAFVLTSAGGEAALREGKPCFEALPPKYRNPALLDLIRLKNRLTPADISFR